MSFSSKPFLLPAYTLETVLRGVLPFRMLVYLMENSTEPQILSVAAHDVGEFVRHYPRGKQ